MNIRIHPESPVPASQQIFDQIRALVAGGSLPPGFQLPTIRQLAGDLGIAPGTVARAYRDLEQQGITEGRGRKGTFIASSPVVDAEQEIGDVVREFALRIAQLGVSPTEALRRAADALGND